MLNWIKAMRKFNLYDILRVIKISLFLLEKELKRYYAFIINKQLLSNSLCNTCKMKVS